MFADISEAKRSQERIDHLAHYDPLTELPNRRLFDDRLQHAIESSRRERQRMAVLIVDLDGFKYVNDSMGHPFGDRLLAGVAQRIAGAVREGDTVARVGGDEFPDALAGLGGQVGGEEAVAVAVPLLGLVHGGIGALQQGVVMALLLAAIAGYLLISTPRVPCVNRPRARRLPSASRRRRPCQRTKTSGTNSSEEPATDHGTQ